MDVEYQCACCGEMNETFVDFSAGLDQEYVEDCVVCCRPNVLLVHVDPDTLRIELNVELEGV